MNYNALKAFIKVASLGSFTKAAHELKQPKSRVSRAIARLEEDLDTELIKRSTRSLSLTEAGKALCQETQGLVEQLEERVESFGDDRDRVSGTLSVSAPVDFGESIMPALLCEFLKLYPHLGFKVYLSDAYVDLVGHDIDLAIRVGKLDDSSMKHKKLTDAQFILVASQEYLDLKGTPKKWQDLSDHSVLSFFNENQHDPLGEMYQMYGFSPLMRINSFPMLRKLAMEAKGIAVLPNTLCKAQIDNGILKRVLPKWSHKKSPVQIVFPASKRMPPKTRAFIDFLVERRTEFF